MNNKRFPTVWKRKGDSDWQIVFVYWKKIEIYSMNGKSTHSDNGYDPFDEEEMLIGNGYRKVHYNDDPED